MPIKAEFIFINSSKLLLELEGYDIKNGLLTILFKNNDLILKSFKTPTSQIKLFGGKNSGSKFNVDMIEYSVGKNVTIIRYITK